MSILTSFLKLLKKDPTAEGGDTFNIKTMLNDNWDKVDTGVKAISDAQSAHIDATDPHPQYARDTDLAVHLADNTAHGVSNKVDKVSGKGISTEDYTTTEKNKLAGIAAGAQVNAVTSVAGRTGAVTLAKADVGLTNVDNVKQLPIAGGTMTGILTAQSNTSYATKQTRNIAIKTGADFTTAELAVGDIGFIY